MISPKQMKILAFPYTEYDALICDGAIRSGKTSIMMWAFVKWAMDNFSGQRFGVCGRTVDSCTKNIIVPFTAMSLARQKYIIRWPFRLMERCYRIMLFFITCLPGLLCLRTGFPQIEGCFLTAGKTDVRLLRLSIPCAGPVSTQEMY